ncbi:MAG: hypothetical protein PUC69_00530 [Ruminococcus sp.]|nr:MULTISPECIES: hypothetical protein [Ruminococcus]MCI5597787.1 hypothetical protein [Ruminococcus sp.]MCI5617362.1 hypothetical protein [Ruminococcus sp.]MCI6505072.1 hypothetical protein [Ruminococcus sp.]MDD5889088.1 hypothetical protein [Ruminococcus sp.]MDY3661797.1 hypothetical protein [Ruminococcus bovis]
MNYREWSENYEKESLNLKSIIDRERDNLNNAKNFDEVKSINRRIQILKSMYYECRLTAKLLKSKAKDLDELVGESVA